MPRSGFERLTARLCDVGYSPRAAESLATQLSEHFQDLVDDLRAAGYDEREAQLIAQREMGSVETVVGCAREYHRRDHWAYRYPLFSRVMLPIAVAALPEFDGPFAPTQTAASLLRWGAILLASATITAAMLLAMQLAITMS